MEVLGPSLFQRHGSNTAPGQRWSSDYFLFKAYPSKHQTLTRLRRWPNIKPALGRYLVSPVTCSLQKSIQFHSTLLLHRVLFYIQTGRCVTSQQTRDVDPMLFLCWADVGDGGPTLKQHWVNVSCLLGPATSERDWNIQW